MGTQKEYFSLGEVAEIVRPEKNGKPLPTKGAIKNVLDLIFNPCSGSWLHPSYEFASPIKARLYTNGL